ncbi:hypothetical protein [Maritalea sp.]|jgi:hypothetical protein|uniref:hypothetical protein n=1 Tax=Maritalea sp. TaxID=2003361 RepID=UPI0039E7263D
MKILRHFTANDEKLDKFDFRRELSMEAYLTENEGILALDEPFVDVNVIAEELTLREGRKSKDTDGRIDLLVAYAQEYIGVVELKLGQLREVHLQQLEDYLEHKERILIDHRDIIPTELATSPKWIGVLVGNAIDEELASRIAAGYTTKHGDIPIAALTLQRFRSEKGNVYVVTESYFKDTSSNRDTSKYLFDDRQFGKGRLVLEVVKKYAAKNVDITYTALENAFPQHCQGSAGVFSTLDDASKIFADTNQKRHFLKPDEIIELSDTKIAVSNQWGVGNIDKFVEKAEELGFVIVKH